MFLMMYDFFRKFKFVDILVVGFLGSLHVIGHFSWSLFSDVTIVDSFST